MTSTISTDSSAAATKLTVLLVGAGGRDHALAWKIAQSERCAQLHVAPGNVGIADVATCHPEVSIDDETAIVELAIKIGAQLVIIGAEDLLVAGLADQIEAVGIPCLGPTAAAAQLEGSKAFSKSLMDQLDIPTAAWKAFDSVEAARIEVLDWTGPIAVKADGLAAGCGAYVCRTQQEALNAIDDLMVQATWGDSGATIIIEDLLVGHEVSVMVLCDGTNLLAMPAARDYKRLATGDEGPNTGGMGAHAPSTDVSADQARELAATMIQPVVDELRRRGTPFRGVIYAGVMLTTDGPFVLEYNCRLGNPETQALVRVLDADLLDLLHKAAIGSLAGIAPVAADGCAIAICLAAQSYPEQQLEQRPFLVRGLVDAADVDGVELFIGMAEATLPVTVGSMLAAGGRMVTVSAHADSFGEAMRNGYRAVAMIDAPGAHFRTDIGQPAVDVLAR